MKATARPVARSLSHGLPGRGKARQPLAAASRRADGTRAAALRAGALHGRRPRGPPVATLRFRDRRALLGLLLDPEVHFGDAYAEGRIEIEGDLVAAIEAAYRGARGPRAAEPARLARDLAAALAAPCAHQRPSPLRPRQRLLRALARRAAPLHLRLLRVPGAVARRSPGREDGPRVPQARPAARGDGGGGRLRLGRPGPAHGTALRSARAGLQHLAGADRLGARACAARGARRPRRLRRGATTGRSGTAATSSCPWACSSTWAGGATASSARVIARCLDRTRRPRPAALHRPRPAVSLERLDPPAHLSRGLSPGPDGGRSPASSSPPACP